jgi:hypothetical protein
VSTPPPPSPTPSHATHTTTTTHHQQLQLAHTGPPTGFLLTLALILALCGVGLLTATRPHRH